MHRPAPTSFRFDIKGPLNNPWNLARRTERMNPSVPAGLDIGVVGPHPAGHGATFEVRAFFPGNSGLAEDPGTGSLNPALGQWLMGAGLAPSRSVAAQGTVWVGGDSVSCITGLVLL